MTTTANEKAAVTSCCNLLRHELESAISDSNYDTKAIEKQLLSSGAIEKLANDLTEHLTQHRTIKIGTQCKGCKRSFVAKMLNLNVLMCRRCLGQAQTEDASKRNRFIAEAARNYVASLRYQISAGGAR